MSMSTITYWPAGTRGFQTDLATASGASISVSGTVGDGSPEPWGDPALCRNEALVMSLWAYSKHEYLTRRSRSDDRRKSHRAAAHQYGDRAANIADYVGRLGTVSGEAWCSCCFRFTEHTQVRGRSHVPIVYLCEGCGSPTTPCLAPRCRNMANRGVGSARLPHYCAEHRHEVASFPKATARLSSLDDAAEWLTFEKRNFRQATKVLTIAGVTAVLVVPAAFGAAPVLGGALGASALGGGLSGAAATSHGLAMLGLGALASGGAGMAGGTAVVVVTGTALGGAMGAVATNTYARDDKSFRIERLRAGIGSPVLLASGFLTDNDDGWGLWQRLVDERYPTAPVYRIHWGSKELKAFGALASTSAGKVVGARLLARAAARSSVRSAGKVPYLTPIALAHELATNPWSTALSRAAKTGAMLADILTRTQTDSFVLVGHSLGARVMVIAAESLATRPGRPKLEAIHLLGAAVAAKRDWRALNDSVTDRVWNYSSANDGVLRYLYRNIQMGRPAAGVQGLRTSYPKIVNQDVSRQVKTHSAYFDAVHLR